MGCCLTGSRDQEKNEQKHELTQNAMLTYTFYDVEE
jgi:hypothetical protein